MSDKWKCRGSRREHTPQQRDNTSCGIFALVFATLTVLQIPLTYFDQRIVKRMRLHVANCLLRQICPLPWCMNESGHRLGLDIARNVPDLPYRLRIRAGIREPQSNITDRGITSRNSGRYIEIDQEDTVTSTTTDISLSMVSGQQMTGQPIQETLGEQVLTRSRGRRVSGSSSFETWLGKIQNHECPSVLSAKEYMTSRNKSLLRQLINTFRNNTRL